MHYNSNNMRHVKLAANGVGIWVSRKSDETYVTFIRGWFPFLTETMSNDEIIKLFDDCEWDYSELERRLKAR